MKGGVVTEQFYAIIPNLFPCFFMYFFRSCRYIETMLSLLGECEYRWEIFLCNI